jgi:hypothetical protein
MDNLEILSVILTLFEIALEPLNERGEATFTLSSPSEI